MPYCRCSKCLARKTMGHPDTYRRLPKCPGCGRKMTLSGLPPPGSREGPDRYAKWRIDKYRERHERGRNSPKCDPGKTGCRGYSFIHRRGSGYCDHNPNLTDEDLQEREHLGRWS